MQHKPVDSSQLNVAALRLPLIVLTALFVGFMLTVAILGGLPTRPTWPTPYSLEEWPTVREQQTQQLTEYQWVNQEQGVVSLPIDRAKDLLVERGLPTNP